MYLQQALQCVQDPPNQNEMFEKGEINATHIYPAEPSSTKGYFIIAHGFQLVMWSSASKSDWHHFEKDATEL